MGIPEVSEAFADLFRKSNIERFQQWELSKKELHVLFNLVEAAGFKPKKITPGRLTAHYTDQKGSKNGLSYVNNETCSYKVVVLLNK